VISPSVTGAAKLPVGPVSATFERPDDWRVTPTPGRGTSAMSLGPASSGSSGSKTPSPLASMNTKPSTRTSPWGTVVSGTVVSGGASPVSSWLSCSGTVVVVVVSGGTVVLVSGGTSPGAVDGVSARSPRTAASMSAKKA